MWYEGRRCERDARADTLGALDMRGKSTAAVELRLDIQGSRCVLRQERGGHMHRWFLKANQASPAHHLCYHTESGRVESGSAKQRAPLQRTACALGLDGMK